jgi:hypothetical protein
VRGPSVAGRDARTGLAFRHRPKEVAHLLDAAAVAGAGARHSHAPLHREHIVTHVAAAARQLVGHVQHQQRRHALVEHGLGEQELCLQPGGVDDQDDRVGERETLDTTR